MRSAYAPGVAPGVQRVAAVGKRNRGAEQESQELREIVQREEQRRARRRLEERERQKRVIDVLDRANARLRHQKGKRSPQAENVPVHVQVIGLAEVRLGPARRYPPAHPATMSASASGTPLHVALAAYVAAHSDGLEEE